MSPGGVRADPRSVPELRRRGAAAVDTLADGSFPTLWRDYISAVCAARGDAEADVVVPPMEFRRRVELMLACFLAGVVVLASGLLVWFLQIWCSCRFGVKFLISVIVALTVLQFLGTILDVLDRVLFVFTLGTLGGFWHHDVYRHPSFQETSWQGPEYVSYAGGMADEASWSQWWFRFAAWIALACAPIAFLRYSNEKRRRRLAAAMVGLEASMLLNATESDMPNRVARLREAIANAGLVLDDKDLRSQELLRRGTRILANWQKNGADTIAELKAVSSPSRFFKTNTARLKKAIAEAKRWKLDVGEAEQLLMSERSAEERQAAKNEPAVREKELEEQKRATQTKRRAAERELSSAMPGWFSATDLPRLKRAIGEASEFGIDVSGAIAALESESFRLQQAALPTQPPVGPLDFGEIADGAVFTVTIPRWPPTQPNEALGVSITDSTLMGVEPQPRMPPIITELTPGLVSDRTGILQVGDIVGAVNGKKVFSSNEAAQLIGQAKGELQLSILRKRPAALPMGSPVMWGDIPMGLPVQHGP